MVLQAFGLSKNRLDVESLKRRKGQDDAKAKPDIRNRIDQKRLGRRVDRGLALRPMRDQQVGA